MKKSAYPYIITAATLWGIISLFVSSMQEIGFSAMDIVFWRSAVTAVLMCIYLFFKDRTKFKIRFRDLWIFAGSGIVSFVFFSFCYFTAMKLTTVSIAAILLYTSPIFVMTFSWVLFKEKLTKKKLLAVILTFFGCVLTAGISAGDYKVTLLGILCGLGSGIGYALYSIFGRYGVEKYSSETVTAYTFIFATIATGFFINKATVSMAIVNVPLITALGVFTCFVPYLLYTKALTLTEPGKAAIIATAEPVVATIVGVFYFGEALSITQAAGIIMVLGAIVMLNIKNDDTV